MAPVDQNQLLQKKQNLLKFRKTLPIYAAKDQILEAIKKNPVLILLGETGSGKTTQIPQFLYEAGYLKNKKIGMTQPRRVAAINVAKRVSEEMGCSLGSKVGYSIRFEDCTSPQTQIKFMTDGMLLRELLSDPLLHQYSVIILDEAHERTLRTDILFSMTKRILQKRKDLKIIVMSATLNAKKFSDFFGGAEIMSVPGRLFPVQTLCTLEPQQDYLDSALITTFQIHMKEEKGDILVFLTGQEEIESLEKLMNQHAKNLPAHCRKLIVCPLFANLPTQQQNQVFSPCPKDCRKVILSTNVAETSVTIPGIRYVIDSGLQKSRGFDPKVGMEVLQIHPISKQSARQRAGRAGREQEGICYRLYTEESFHKLAEEEVPEIKRCNMANVILMLKASGVENVLELDYLDMPSKNTLSKALQELHTLGALDDEQKLTPLGKQMSNFPLEPPFSKILILSKQRGCLEEVIDIISLLSVENLFYYPADKREEVGEMKKKFNSFDGDLITYLNVLCAFLDHGKEKDWCQTHFIHQRSIQHVLKVRKQLFQFCQKLQFLPKDFNLNDDIRKESSVQNEKIIQCFLEGFKQNIAILQPDQSYKSLFNHQIMYLHPSSVLFGKKCPIIVFTDLIWTSKKYMRHVSRVEKDWLQQLGK